MDPMTVVSVNRAMPEHIVLNGEDFYTAIAKQPTAGPVAVGVLGLEGDGVGSKRHHGGPDQAVYLYGTDDYEWWNDRLGQSLDPGTFGENLTVRGLSFAGLAIGDRLRVGGALVLEVTAPRIPCSKLAARMLDGTFIDRFREARRPGAYTRVIEEGAVRKGDSVVLQPAAGRNFTLLDMFELFYQKDAPREFYARGLRAPIAERARLSYERAVAEN